MPTMKEIFSTVSEQLQKNAENNKGISGVFQFDISGDDPMNFYLKLDNGTPETGEGNIDNPNITISMNSSDYKDLVDGKLNGTMAFMSGKLKVKGDISLAMKLESILK